MSEETPDKPKIIVDEDWKSQVQAEKETAKHQPQAAGESAQAFPLPEASFTQLVTLLATQAAAALGQGAPPDQEEIVVDLGVAQHMIDLLGMLEEKTKGNLSEQESDMLAQVLHSLRMLYVAYKKHAENQPPEETSPIITE
jgi:hypothetical protein